MRESSGRRGSSGMSGMSGMSGITCARARGWLNLYVDGRLPLGRLRALEEHVLGCAACRRELVMLEGVREALHEGAAEVAPEPAELHMLIMARIAAYEAARREAQAAVAAAKAVGAGAGASFGLRWADALLAAALATLSTLLFVLLDPGLRVAVPAALLRSFPGVAALLSAPGPGAVAWAAWLVWIVAGVGLALLFAGAEVRMRWRRSLAARLPQLPQLRQLS
jgi:anti-sigma factor RsiW